MDSVFTGLRRCLYLNLFIMLLLLFSNASSNY
jgi:hypothetical protein